MSHPLQRFSCASPWHTVLVAAIPNQPLPFSGLKDSFCGLLKGSAAVKTNSRVEGKGAAQLHHHPFLSWPSSSCIPSFLLPSLTAAFCLALYGPVIPNHHRPLSLKCSFRCLTSLRYPSGWNVLIPTTTTVTNLPSQHLLLKSVQASIPTLFLPLSWHEHNTHCTRHH